jgi:DNA-directed RNA polymerase specialized sigma24 family protein
LKATDAGSLNPQPQKHRKPAHHALRLCRWGGDDLTEMAKERFKFLSTDAFSKLSQQEKLDYLAHAVAALGKTANTSQHFEQDRPKSSPGTLGAVLYARKSKTPLSEKDWVGLVRSVAERDQVALHALYERTHRVVFTLIERITGSREAAKELTVGMFCDAWQQAPHYDAENGTVLGWIMNLARSRAIEHLRFKQRNVRVDDHEGAPLPSLETGYAPRQPASLQQQLARHIAAEMGTDPVLPPTPQWLEPAWEEVAPKISCKLLATDAQRHRVSMLVRLAPGGDYPSHSHAGVEELHLLNGELWIEDRKLYPGDYNRAEPGTGDKRVWSETGCTCVLITSTEDILC